MLSRQIIPERVFCEDDAACRRAWAHTGLAQYQTPGTGLCQTVNVLVGIDLFDRSRFVQPFRQRQLQQDPVNSVIRVEV